MTAKKKPTTRKKPPPKVADDDATRARDIHDLGINVPIYRTRIVGDRLELHCYGGQVLYWPHPPPSMPIPCAATTKAGRPCRQSAILCSDPPRCLTHQET